LLTLHNAASGVDTSAVEPRGRAESVSRIATLKENTRDLPVIIETVTARAQDVHAAAADRGLGFRTVTIQAVTNDLTSFTRSRTVKTPTKSLEVITTAARDLLEQLLTEEPDRSMRRVGVKNPVSLRKRVKSASPSTESPPSSRSRSLEAKPYEEYLFMMQKTFPVHRSISSCLRSTLRQR
jgi:nucleotidyltransferase/DNA polymerase involved in DNA repair